MVHYRKAKLISFHNSHKNKPKFFALDYLVTHRPLKFQKMKKNNRFAIILVHLKISSTAMISEHVIKSRHPKYQIVQDVQLSMSIGNQIPKLLKNQNMK